MGTRSLTFVYDEKYGRRKPKAIINMYRQYDGYPTGHGAELAEFLAPFEMVSGIPVTDDETPRKIANGMGCLAAQLVSNFKAGAGQFYLYPTSAIDCGQDYEYHIYRGPDNALRVGITNRGCNFFGLTTSDTNEKIFDGNLVEFTEFCTEKETA